MIAEALMYARSLPATPAAFRRHLGPAVAYWGHGVRQFRAWTPHLSKMRSLLDTTLDDIPSRHTVAVLGSGPLFDIPTRSASAPIVTPSRPTSLASESADPRIVCRVSSPLPMDPIIERSFYSSRHARRALC